MPNTEEILQAAIAEHEAGRLAAAEEAYQQVLAVDPQQADALHLLGVIELQRGSCERAVSLIERAVGLMPHAPIFHANLAEAYRLVGDNERSAQHAQTALVIDPTFAAAANTLGAALFVMGRTKLAADYFRTAIRLNPDFAMARNNLANVLLQAGDTSGAAAEFQRAIELDPHLAAAHSNLGQILLEQGQPREALEPSRAAARLWPQSPEIQNNLGNVLRELNLLEEAKAAYAEALRLAPDLAMTWSNMGKLLHEQGRLADAVAWCRRAADLAPQSSHIQCALAIVLFEQGDLPAAAQCYETAIRLEPESAVAHNGLGRVRERQGRFGEALTLFRRAIELKPSLADAHRNLGVILQGHGQFREAEDALREALRRDPRHTSALAELAMLLRAKTPGPDLDASRRMLADSTIKDAQRWPLAFGLATALDAQGHYVEAAEYFQQANSLCRDERQRYGDGYDPGAHARFVDRTIATCTPAFFERVRGFGLASERPIFIFGLPRSGTSLVEQILASHSQVFGAGELGLAREDFDALADDLVDLDRERVQLVAQRHLQRLEEVNHDALRVTDKMPENYFYLGLLAVLFPRAKFIHCRRDLRDTALSCWMTNFLTTRWANDPADIAAHFGQYLRLMNHWRAVLPVPLFEVDYEEMVADLESVARRLVNWCGLEWEPACLDFHQTNRPVHTASNAQVRRPIYATSVGRWRNYQPALESLFEEVAAMALRNEFSR